MEILVIIELGLIITLGISLLFLASYQRLLRDFYLLKEGIERQGVKRGQTEKFEKILTQKVGAEIEKAGEAARKEISKAASAELKDFITQLSEKSLESQEAVETALAHEFDEAKAQIEVFKAKKMSEVANKAEALVSDVVRKTLGKEIGSKEHEELVFKALEDAKRQNLL